MEEWIYAIEYASCNFIKVCALRKYVVSSFKKFIIHSVAPREINICLKLAEHWYANLRYLLYRMNDNQNCEGAAAAMQMFGHCNGSGEF